MNEPLSHVRLLVLVVLLVAETALAISLRTSGWTATGDAIRLLLIAVAVVLPFIMTAVLLYRVRISLRHRRFSLRALMALTLISGSFLALLPLFERPDRPNLGPLPLSKSVTFEVYEVAATSAPDGLTFADPDTGTVVPVKQNPFVTAADVSTVQLTPIQNEDSAFPSLTIVLSPTGEQKIRRATTPAQGGRLVIVADGKVLCAPKVRTPIGGQFQVTGGIIHAESNDVFDALTEE